MKRSGYQDEQPRRPKRVRKSPKAASDSSPSDGKSASGIRSSKGPVSKRLTQSVLQFKGDAVTTTCSVCEVTYRKKIKADVQYHEKNHDLFVNGLLWPFSVEKTVAEMLVKTPKPAKIAIVEAQTASDPQIRRVEETLAVVNKELNAAKGSSQWKRVHRGSFQSKALLAICDSRIIGLCTTEILDDIPKRSRWMVHRTKSIVENQVNRNAVVGISRIWVLSKWRRLGIAQTLLEAVLQSSAYGVVLTRNNIAFSQPSTSGGLLAEKFNGAVHKTGEVLIPVYLED